MALMEKFGLRAISMLLAGMLALLAVIWLIPLPGPMQGSGFMPLWIHSGSETFAIVVAMLVFGVVWNSYRIERHGNLMILACGLLAVGLIDFMHMLSFTGMPDFVTPASVEKGINFWLAARLLVALTLLAVAVKPWQPFKSRRTPYSLLAAAFAVVALVAWLGLFHPTWWPRTFIAGQGLTPFKIYAELAISLLLLIAAGLFYRHASSAKPQIYDAGSLFAAAAITIMSELCFVLYSSVTDIYSLIGHLYKIVAYLFIYRAVFASSVRQPYQQLQLAQESLADSQQVLQSILDNVPVRIFWRDRELRYLGANKLYLQDAGIGKVEDILGRKNSELFTDHTDKYAEDDFKIMATGISKLNYEEPILRADGTPGWLLTSKVPLRNHEGEIIGILGTYNDISERKQAEEMIQYQASYDLLTQLPNRRLFYDRLRQEVHKSQRSQLKLALLLLDLDNFKEVNDTLGHAVGDELLRQIAGRLSKHVRAEDVVARLGGDEFIVVIAGLPDPTPIERIAQQLINGISEPIHLQDDTIYPTVSMGVTVYPDDSDNIDDLLKNADQAMYDAKRQGRNRYSYFTPAMQQVASRRAQLTRELREALAASQFRVVYQPIVTLATGAIVKTEALMRWQHPVHGNVSPAEFIPVAEASGIIVDMGAWIFREAAQQALRWRQIDPSFQVSINKSPVEFGNSQRHTMWLQYLETLGLPGDGIIIEITEGLLLDASSTVTKVLSDCRQAGMQISLDDFGTGYASLSYLKKFDIDYLKIDKSFIGNLAPGSNDLALCEAIIVMAHSLGIKVVAEGVETQQQRDLLLAAGCDYGQGYLFHRPLAAEEIDKLL
jgi:diguanylate cyclase (GGDEF)-like protein/PAS domain S-box-containing protein